VAKDHSLRIFVHGVKQFRLENEISLPPEVRTEDWIVAFPVPCGRNGQRDDLKSIVNSNHKNKVLRFKNYKKGYNMHLSE
jgi:hypothetical protein